MLHTSVLVMAEIVWTLEPYYELPRPEIRDKVLAMLNTAGLKRYDEFPNLIEGASSPVGDILTRLPLRPLPSFAPEVGLGLLDNLIPHQSDRAALYGHGHKIPRLDAGRAANGSRQRDIAVSGDPG